MAIRLGLTGYLSLRRDLLHPIDSPDQYFALIEDVTAMNGGEAMHFMPLKALRPDCHVPPPDAEEDEIKAHQSVHHFGNALRVVMRYAESAPDQGRRVWLSERPLDFEAAGIQLPELDVVIAEATGHPASGYGLDQLLYGLYRKNPNIGFIVMDCDLASATVISKMKHWLPNWEERVVVATYFVKPRGKTGNQAVAVKQHLGYRQMPTVMDGNDLCYVGNDYKRREPMQRFFQGPRFHWYGRYGRLEKGEFRAVVKELGCIEHGSYVVEPGKPLEQAYRNHGIGLNMARDEYYRLNMITPRVSEIIRSGCLMFMDHKLRIAKPIAGDWCMVNDAADCLEKADFLANNPGYWRELIAYQQQAASYFMDRTKHARTLFTAAEALANGPVRDFKLNLYEELCAAAGLDGKEYVWSNVN